MKGGRQLFTCPACGKCFFYWVNEAVPQPKVKCYYCNADSFPHGEPPAAPAPPPATTPQPAAAPATATAPEPAAASAPEPAAGTPEPAAAAPPVEGTPAH